MNIVAYLFSFIAIYPVCLSFQIASDQIAQKSVLLHSGMIGAGEAAATQATGWHLKVAPILLHHHIGRYFGSAKNGMHRLIDWKCFGYAICARGIAIIPACLFLQQ